MRLTRLHVVDVMWSLCAPFSRLGKRYELPLLTQSIIMVGTMLVMMHLCTTVKAEEGTIVTRRLLGQSCNRTVCVKAFPDLQLDW